ncbi:unnamed protein product [Staurois parvus]|uniref:Uncharacterized protein n=1 Tax=Staurois parvus TaxID=386267 RepID=A0ABN9BTZ2_9NEOB|nr:unnamed protein product [Staurois parvus]
MMGPYSSTDTNDGALFLPLTPMMGHDSSHCDTNDGALFLPLTLADSHLYTDHLPAGPALDFRAGRSAPPSRR